MRSPRKVRIHKSESRFCQVLRIMSEPVIDLMQPYMRILCSRIFGQAGCSCEEHGPSVPRCFFRQSMLEPKITGRSIHVFDDFTCSVNSPSDRFGMASRHWLSILQSLPPPPPQKKREACSLTVSLHLFAFVGFSSDLQARLS